MAVVEGIKRIIESMNKRIDSYIFYAKNNVKGIDVKEKKEVHF